MDVQPLGGLEFPDAPKLELDTLIDQLVDRARDVQHSQGRLRALLRAIATMTENPSLDAVLLNVVEAARTLTGAGYGALGVIGFDDGLEQFIHVGMDQADVARIGGLPKGLGLLGALIHDSQSIRLANIVSDSRSSGFPDGHPPMESFLGVPVRVGGRVFGNLYLTDSATGRFSAEDEELTRALAAAAGTAISNARLLQESRLQQRWLTASVEISAQLLAENGDDPLKVIASRALEIANADVVTVSLLTADRTELVVEAASGQDAFDLLGRRFAVASSRVCATVERGSPLLRSHDDGVDLSDRDIMDVGPLMALPLQGTTGIRGVLSVVRAPGRRPFDDTDLAMAGGFAAHASVALELADARAAAQRLARSEDRDRIARDLHDHVIQELFAIGLGLEATATFVEPGGVAAARIAQRVRDIDRTIRQIRTSIFELRGPLDSSAESTRSYILQIGADLTEALGFKPQIVFSGLVDIRLNAELAEDVFACVREVLTNVAKHAQATRADIDLSVSLTTVTLIMSDNGVGYSPNGRLSGLANLRVRAEQRGGSFDISAADGRGTILTWKAPL
jgi:signal transduction histidine kinase